MVPKQRLDLDVGSTLDDRRLTAQHVLSVVGRTSPTGADVTGQVGGNMAELAGMVNDRGRENDAVFAEITAGSSPAIQELARAVRNLIYDILPQTIEVVWPRQGSVGWGTGVKKFTEQFAYLMPFKGHITLGFYHGGELSDPHGLLPATGGRQVGGKLTMRSLRIISLEQVRDPALRELIKAATVTGIPPIRN
jgi:hypothetical protein